MSAGITSVGLVVNNEVLAATNTPLVQNGNIGLNFARSGVVAGTYIYPSQVTVDHYGRVLNIVAGTSPVSGSGTVTSVSVNSASLSVSGSPIQLAGAIGIEMPLVGSPGTYYSPSSMQTDKYGRVVNVVAGGVGSPYYIADFGKVSLTPGFNYIECSALIPGASLLFQPIVQGTSSNINIQNIQIQSNLSVGNSNANSNAGFCVTVDPTSEVVEGYYAVIVSSAVFSPTLYGASAVAANIVAAGSIPVIPYAPNSCQVNFPELTESSVVFLSSYNFSSGASVSNPVVGKGFQVTASAVGTVYYMVLDVLSSTPLAGASILSGGSVPVSFSSFFLGSNQWNIPLYGCSIPSIPVEGPTNFAVFPTILGGSNITPVSCGYALNNVTSVYSHSGKSAVEAGISVGCTSPFNLNYENYATDISYLTLTW